MNRTDQICADARALFAERDRLAAALRSVDATLAKLKSEYMIEERTCGLRDERFRMAVHEVKVAA